MRLARTVSIIGSSSSVTGMWTFRGFVDPILFDLLHIGNSTVAILQPTEHLTSSNLQIQTESQNFRLTNKHSRLASLNLSIAATL